jgi:hypothetical protein
LAVASNWDRDALIEEVRYGRMTPEEAEAESARLGLRKLAREPDDSSFDPMGETFWTLPMVVAWIVWRRARKVRDYFDPYRRECFDWHFRNWRVGPDGSVHSGHFLEKRSPATLMRLSLDARFDAAERELPHDALTVAGAKAALWKALAENRIEATGISISDGERMPIPSYEWRDLKDFEESGRDVVRTDLGVLLTSRIYRDVVFRRQAIMATWTPHRSEEKNLELPPTISPTGPGYMPLSAAAQWIATKGGTIQFKPNEESCWKSAFDELLDRIASQDVKIIGMKNGQRAAIPGELFAGMRVSYPFVERPFELMIGDELYLDCYGYIDAEHWDKGFDDALRDRSGAQWGKLSVLKSDVVRWWPEGHSAPDQIPLRTGAPGRPTSMHLIQAEHAARWDRGDAESSLKAEAVALRDWFIGGAHAGPVPTAGTIENRIRNEHRSRIGKPRN